MIKKELTALLSRKTGLSKKEADIAVKTIFDTIVDSLSNGEKVELRGFGSFTVRNRLPRKGRNPKTGETVNVPARKVPFFKSGKDMKILPS